MMKRVCYALGYAISPLSSIFKSKLKNFGSFLTETKQAFPFSSTSSSKNISKEGTPFVNTLRILKNEITGKKGAQFPKHVDILIVGGGIIGSSIAYWLKQRASDSFSTLVLERDQTYTRSTSVLSVGGIRQQFSLPENIELSLYSSQFLRNYRQHLSCLDRDVPDISFQHHGYLFLASEEGVEQLRENHKVQLELGGRAQLLTAKGLKEKFPWINTNGIALGSYGLENEGWFDPWALLSAFRYKAMSLGAEYISANLTGFRLTDMQGFQYEGEPKQTTNYAIVKTPDGKEHEIEFAILIVAGGPYSGEIAKMMRIGTGPGMLETPIPVEPRKRYVYVYHCPEGPGIECPLLIDPNGTYFRREGLGGNFIGGRSPSQDEEPDVTNLDVDYTFFDNKVWPTLAERVPCFEGIKIKSAWAGFYDYNTLDQNAIIGTHPYYPNVIFATGFSGHGIQMAPAVGRAVMELLLDGRYRTIDLKRFCVERIIKNEPIFESNIV